MKRSRKDGSEDAHFSVGIPLAGVAVAFCALSLPARLHVNLGRALGTARETANRAAPGGGALRQQG